jgi:methyl-accepting chemotaxis protein
MNRSAAVTQSAAKPLPVPASAEAHTHPLSDFFRYHGIWAPGVRLFRAIGFRAKALLISCVFVLPIGALSYSYFSDKAAAIDFSAKERVGVAYLRQTVPLLPVLQAWRLAAIQAAARATAGSGSGGDAPPALAPALQALATAQATQGAELDTGKAHAELLARIKALPAASAGVQKVLAAHNEVSAALIALITAATDNSNLTLDPDLDTYYLMDSATAALPALQDSAALLRDLAVSPSKGGEADAGAQRQMVVAQTLSHLAEDRLNTSVQKVDGLHPSLKQAFGIEAVRGALLALHQQVDAARGAAAVESQGATVLQLLQVLHLKTIDKLDSLLEARVQGLQTGRNITTAVLAFSLLLVTYLFVSFRKVLDGGLTEVAFHIEAMRDGNLTTHPRAWGADEAARLMHTLGEMQQSLRGIVRQVRGSSDSIVSASTQIAGGAADLQVRTEQTAASLQETAAAMEEITATVHRNGDTVQEATRLAGNNAEAAERGSRIIGDVMQTMQGINVSSQRISDIIGTIDGIAFQTNILALNAAVEAARAGEQGRGFAVVAAEVRALAQRSAGAAREIKSLITTSVEQVAGGVKVAHEAEAAMQAMLGSTQRVRELLDAVAVGSREQNQGVAQSTVAVQEMDTATQQNAALVEQTAAAAMAMQQQAQQLAGGVARFQLPA